MSEIVKADPTKGFFIDMLTKDILLQDCILDLADNCIDGANRVLAEIEEKTGIPVNEERRYKDFVIAIMATPTRFCIEDNCGGISIELAKNRVFYFGRPTPETEMNINSIGLYGIGMKRALFKMGTNAKVSSSHQKNAFEVAINVPDWAKSPKWEFSLDRIKKFKKSGTRIEIDTLTLEAATHFQNQTFIGLLRKVLARDYSFFLQKGLTITLNSKPVAPHLFQLREGEDLQPMHEAYDDEGVKVTISAGLASIPPDDASPADAVTEVDYFGWFVTCNDRVVLAADKGTKTVWGDLGFSVWHPQYNGFLGIVTFSSTVPAKLPWSTTKRDVDQLNAVYRRAITRMKVVTKQYTQYSNSRKSALKHAKEAEAKSTPIDIRRLAVSSTMRLPSITADTSYVTVSYQAKKDDVKKAAKLMGSANMPATKVGSKSLEYYLENES